MINTESLKNNRDFQSIYARGKSSAGVYLAIYYRKNRLNRLRLGITVSSKLGGAVIRNRVRRRIKEHFRKIESGFINSVDIVIVARTRCIDAPFLSIGQDMVKISTKLKIFTAENNL